MTIPQTINQFVKNPSRIVKNIAWRFPKTQSQERHIFVVGAPRSGTTLVKLILGAHPNLSGPGYETGIFMYKDIFSIGFENLSKKELEQIRKESRDLVDFFDRFAQLNLSKTGGERFIEKTPPHVLRLKFLLKYFPHSQFINIYRDGRDCYCSARHHVNVVQGSNVKRYARYWKRCIIARLQQGNNPRVFDLKYEDLVSTPEASVKEMMDFLQEDYDPRQIDSRYYSQNRITKSKRQEFSKLSQSINQSSLSRWQKELSPEEVSQFQQIAGRELAQLRYQ